MSEARDTPSKPRSLDFSEDGRFPAMVRIELGSGYKFAAALTDDEAQKLMEQVTAWAERDST